MAETKKTTTRKTTPSTKKKGLKDMTLTELANLHTVVSEVCSDYARMTDQYALATGDSTFQSMPKEMYDMINDRQEFFEYKNKIKSLITLKIRDLLKQDE